MQLEYSDHATGELANYIKNFDRNTQLAVLKARVMQLLDSKANSKVIYEGKTLPDILYTRDIYDSDRTTLVDILVERGADFSTHAARAGWVQKYPNKVSSSILHKRYPHLLAEESVKIFLGLPINDAARLRDFLTARSEPFDVNLRVDEVFGRTRMYEAISVSAVEFVRVLLQYGARLDIKDANNMSPLDHAIVSMKVPENSVVARRMYDLVWQETCKKMSLEDVYHVNPPNEVVCEQPPTATAMRIREIFNFKKGVYTQVIDDLANDKQTSTIRTFDEAGEIGAIALARKAFRKATGHEAPQQAYYQNKIVDKTLPQP